QPPFLIEDSLAVRDESILLGRSRAGSPEPDVDTVADIRDLHDLIDRVEAPEQFVVERDVHDLVLRQHLSDLVLEVLPFPRTPEVVHHQKPAGEKIATQSLYLRGG